MVGTVVPLRSSAVSAKYLVRDGYYMKHELEHRLASFWFGGAAQALGLKAHVLLSRFESVLSGYVPGTDLRLGRMREGEHVHRPGWDITLSAPKSVSLETLVMGDRRVIRAHDEAVRATLDFVEAELLQTRGWDPATRRRPRVKANGMVVAGFRHISSRDQDPQLHTHCVLASMRAGRGKGTALANGETVEKRLVGGGASPGARGRRSAGCCCRTTSWSACRAMPAAARRPCCAR